jgi:hypothetical protein
MSCQNCDKKFKSRKLLQIHIDKRACYPRICEVCNKTYRDDRDLKRHEKSNIHKKNLEERAKPTINDILGEMKERTEKYNREMIVMMGAIVKNNPELKVDNKLLGDFIGCLGGGIKIEVNQIFNPQFHFHHGSINIVKENAEYLYRLLSRGSTFKTIVEKISTHTLNGNIPALCLEDGKVLEGEISHDISKVLEAFKKLFKEKLYYAEGICKDNRRELSNRIREKESNEEDVTFNDERRAEIAKIEVVLQKINSLLLSIPSVLSTEEYEKIDACKVLEDYIKLENEVDEIFTKVLRGEN